MIGRTLGCLLVVLCLAEAFVDFGTSRVYDEYDFKGSATVTIDDLCADTCAIYATIDANAKKLASNLLLQLPKGFVSVADIAAQFDAATGQKSPLIVNKTAKLSIMNGNAQSDAGPLVLYVINNYYAQTDGYEVYDAEGFHRQESTLPGSITLMSVRPFTLTEAPKNPIRGGGCIATMTGFDHMDEQVCPYLYYSISNTYSGFTAQVNGPIFSVMWDKYDFNYPPGDLSATIGITNSHYEEKSGFVSSWGYHGCVGKEAYQSSLNNGTVHAVIAFDDSDFSPDVRVNVDVRTNADKYNPVNITDVASRKKESVTETGDAQFVIFQFNTQKLAIDFVPEDFSRPGAHEPQYHFLARWHEMK